MSSWIVVRGITGGGRGREGDGERAGLVGLVKRSLADEVGFVDEANDGGGAAEQAVLCFASWDGAGAVNEMAALKIGILRRALTLSNYVSILSLRNRPTGRRLGNLELS